MQVTVTGGAGHGPAVLSYNANDLAYTTAKALAASIDSQYSHAIYYHPSSPPSTPASGYLIIKPEYSSNFIDARGFSAVVDENAGHSTVVGGDSASGQKVLASNGGLTFFSSSGKTTVVAGGGNNLITFGGDTSKVAAYTSNGNDTIVGGDGHTTIAAGAGHNRILLGAGASMVSVTGGDTITLGSGRETIDVMAGARALVYGTNSTTASGFSLVFIGGSMKPSTVMGGAGRYSIYGGAGGGVFTGGSGGHNSIVAGTGSVTITGGGPGDTLEGGSGRNLINAALGNETLISGTGHDTIDLSVHDVPGASGMGTKDLIKGFGTHDFLHVGNSAAESYALSTYHVSGNNGYFLLEDGTKVILQGFTHLTSHDFK